MDYLLRRSANVEKMVVFLPYIILGYRAHTATGGEEARGCGGRGEQGDLAYHNIVALIARI
jgi:hypothetical protein